MMLDGIKALEKIKAEPWHVNEVLILSYLENHLQVYILNIKSDF